MRRNRSDAGGVEVGKAKAGYGEGLSVGPPEFIELYRAFRTAEAREKGRLFTLKNGVLVGSLLNRALCAYEISMVFTSVKEIILGSELLPKARQALLNRLADPVRIELIPTPAKPADPPVPRQKPDGWTDYMFERLREVASRAENFRLRADELESELLTRNLFEAEFAQLVSAIKSIIGRSRLSPREKSGVKRNLDRLDDVFDSVARQQSRSGSDFGELSRAVTETKNGNGSGDE